MRACLVPSLCEYIRRVYISNRYSVSAVTGRDRHLRNHSINGRILTYERLYGIISLPLMRNRSSLHIRIYRRIHSRTSFRAHLHCEVCTAPYSIRSYSFTYMFNTLIYIYILKHYIYIHMLRTHFVLLSRFPPFSLRTPIQIQYRGNSLQSISVDHN